MSDAVFDPLSRYTGELREKFSDLTADKFEEMTKSAGVDVAANRRQVRLIKKLQKSMSAVKYKLGAINFFLLLLTVGLVFLIVSVANAGDSVSMPMLLATAADVIFIIMLCFAKSKNKKVAVSLAENIEKEKDVAWRQMKCLNRLYSWTTTTSLIEQAFPNVRFDLFCSRRRIDEFERRYGLDMEYFTGRSLIFAQSGVLNGNPFILAEYLEQSWEEQVYSGSLSISWNESGLDSNGKHCVITRSETLTASVVKPVPVYSREKILIYGNHAAPALNFSRVPSGLAGKNCGFVTKIKRRTLCKSLEKHSRNLDDDSNYTIMGNREFETLFCTKDRDNEVEYRLMFTALAQIQMLNLINDGESGCGEGFTFVKRGRVNYLKSGHLDDAEVETSPESFFHWNYDEAKRRFDTFNKKYFKDFYFAIAPFLAIPLYQSAKSGMDAIGVTGGSEELSQWEYESIANSYGDGMFMPEGCDTQCVLKADLHSRSGDGYEVAVTAHGYEGVGDCDYVEVWGGDGQMHSVPVEWIDYRPVRRTTMMRVCPREDAGADTIDEFKKAESFKLRRSVLSYLPTR